MKMQAFSVSPERCLNETTTFHSFLSLFSHKNSLIRAHDSLDKKGPQTVSIVMDSTTPMVLLFASKMLGLAPRGATIPSRRIAEFAIGGSVSGARV